MEIPIRIYTYLRELSECLQKDFRIVLLKVFASVICKTVVKGQWIDGIGHISCVVDRTKIPESSYSSESTAQ